MRGDAFFMEMASRPPFSRLHPKLAAFFKEYLSNEKVQRFDERFVVNVHLPPFPGLAFDRMVSQFDAIGEAGSERKLFSVTWAITNRCPYQCWHCYNAGRKQQDVQLATLRRLAAEMNDLGAVVVTLTGGEPLLRDDLEEVADALGDSVSLVMNTTGWGLTASRARALADRGLFAVGISLDSADEAEHDRLRGHVGAFRTALEGLRASRDAGLYPYIVSVATREFLVRSRFMRFLRFAQDHGALEVHLLEPIAAGRLAGRDEVQLDQAERRVILDYQREMAARDDLPILSSFTYFESAEVFGCGAGLTHLYIDGSGEVCPCNMVPLSFGNVRRDTLREALDRMGDSFEKPRCHCVGRPLSAAVRGDPLPVPPGTSAEVCRRTLPAEHEVPRFFRLQSEARGRVGVEDLRQSYDRVHGDYDRFWLSEAGRPVDEIIEALALEAGEQVFEAGCGTGYATQQLASGVGDSGCVVAVDISEGMIREARRRLGTSQRVRFLAGDALEMLQSQGSFDVVFSSWVLGYIELSPFFDAASEALPVGGRLAFVVHKKNSPQREMRIFAELIAEDPSALQKQVDFDFPVDSEQVCTELDRAGFEVDELREGTVVFRYADARGALDHLLKSGAGTAFYDAVDPGKRSRLEQRFMERLAGEAPGAGCEVVHEYVTCIGRKVRDADSARGSS